VTELERMYKEATVTCFEVLYQRVHGGTEANHDTPQVNRAPCPWPSD
jgi:hypothetical protein